MAVWSSRRGLALSLSLAGTSCAGPVAVDRVYGAHRVDGRAIEPPAYAAFLRGALDEASGDTRQALDEYRAALRLDPAGPEIWARIGTLRCALDPRDPAADDALRHALAIDPGYEGAWTARALCARVRGDDEDAARAAEHAAAIDPSAAGSLSPEWMAGRDPAARASLLAATVAASDPEVAFRALADWAEGRADVDLRARALIALVRSAPLRRAAIALEAEAIAGDGALRQARSVAAAVVDAWDQPWAGEPPSLAARLAVDEAIARKDADLVRRRCARARVPLEQAAARALLAGETSLARGLAAEVARASPGDRNAREVLRAAAGAPGGDVVDAGLQSRESAPDATRRPGPTRGKERPIQAEVWIALGVALASATRSDEARATLSAMVHEPLPLGDERVLRPAVDLAWRGLIDAASLPPDGALELRVLRASPSVDGPEADRSAVSATPALDARHVYLTLALSGPRDRRAAQLGERLGRIAPDDRVVAVARELAFLGQGAPATPSRAESLLARDPSDPLTAVTALRLAERCGDADTARRARAAVAALKE